MFKLKAIIEGLLFLSGDEGISIDKICKITEQDKECIIKLISELENDYSNTDRGIQIEVFGDYYKLTTKKEHKDYYKKLVLEEENTPLSNSAIETLAIIAYNAPITRVEIDEIRGVNSTYVVRKLLLKGLIEDVGKSDLPGRPKLYNVTDRFLDYFGLSSINQLPELESAKEIENDEKSLFESKYSEEEI